MTVRGDAGTVAPLAGLTVVEIGHSVAGPYAGQVLADLGAEVFKVERPGAGDDAREWGPPFWEGASAVFQTLNRNKRSVTLDLKDPDDRTRLAALAEQADIVLQNLRPGLVERLGIDAGTLRAANPGLIYCNLSAFGRDGPLRAHAGYDPLVQAFSGIMSVTGEEGRPPVRVGPSIVDMGSGLWCVIGILAALVRRSETGEGTTVDTSLYETGLAWMNIPLANSMASGRVLTPSGSETPMLAPYRAFRADDRYIVIAAGNDGLFRRLCDVLGQPGWPEDPRFATNADRVANREVLNAMIEGVVATRSAHLWTEALVEVGVPCAPLQTTSEVIAHPQTQALNMIQPTPGSRMALVALPISFDGVRPAIQTAAPALGADNEALDHVLASPGEGTGR